MNRILFAAFFLITTATTYAQDKLITLETRSGVSVPFYYMKVDSARATVVLLPGGGGDINMRDGVPTSNNFLTRSRDRFAAAGFNVAVVSRPSDTELEYEFRISREHMADLQQVLAYLKKDSGLPIWLVATSRGTVSAAAATIAFGNPILAGLVMTSSVTSPKRAGALPAQNLAAIRIPVLVIHHQKDACVVTRPDGLPSIMRGLTNASVKKLVMMDGGSAPVGDPCEGLHSHGFVGLEQEVVNIITEWISNPKN